MFTYVCTVTVTTVTVVVTQQPPPFFLYHHLVNDGNGPKRRIWRLWAIGKARGGRR